MTESVLAYFRQELNELRIKVERNEQKLFFLDENSKGSLSTREERAATTASIKGDIKNLEDEIVKLQRAKEKLDDRFFQVWVGIGFVGLGVIIDFLISRA